MSPRRPVRTAARSSRLKEDATVALKVRPFAARDLDAVTSMRAALWPDGTAAEHRKELRAFLAGRALSTLPFTVLVAEDEHGDVIGFADVGLRSHADGCDPARPVGYLEGWFVAKKARRRGVGRALVAAAESWSRDHGCTEMASDTWVSHQASIRAHRKLGFEVGDRVVVFRKSLVARKKR